MAKKPIPIAKLPHKEKRKILKSYEAEYAERMEAKGKTQLHMMLGVEFKQELKDLSKELNLKNLEELFLFFNQLYSSSSAKKRKECLDIVLAMRSG